MLTYCDPHIPKVDPPDFEGAKLSQIFGLVCEYIRYFLAIIHRNFHNKNKSVLLLAAESYNNRNAILIIPIYTSVDHSISAIPMAERKLCAGVDGNICWMKFTKFF